MGNERSGEKDPRNLIQSHQHGWESAGSRSGSRAKARRQGVCRFPRRSSYQSKERPRAKSISTLQLSAVAGKNKQRFLPEAQAPKKQDFSSNPARNNFNFSTVICASSPPSGLKAELCCTGFLNLFHAPAEPMRHGRGALKRLLDIRQSHTRR